jgi:hypothetical protein
MNAIQPRAVDAPDISATRFLVAVMHDRSLDIQTRMNAADQLCRMGLGIYKEREIRITINVGGASNVGGVKMLNHRAEGAYDWASK